MDKKNAIKILEFISSHYDYVRQDDWFEFCDMLMGMVVDSANKKKFAKELVAKFPQFFRSA